MILVVAFLLGVLTVPLAGGRLRALADLRLRRTGILIAALVLQFVALKGHLPHGVAALLNVGSYFMGCWYLLANLNIPGMMFVGLGAACNMLAMLANGGVMPASAKALAAAGLSERASGFVNSALVPDAQVAFFGDIFSIPKTWPLANVFSIGDVLIFVGGLIAVHRICGSRLFPKPHSDFRRLRANRDFMSLWTAQAASNLGDWVYTMAVFASLGERAEPHVFATLLLAEVGPSAVTGFLGGPLVDRLSRKWVMVASDVVRAAAVASLFLDHNPPLAHLYAVAACLGVMRALAQPALQASLPNVVPPEDLLPANSLVSATYHSAVMLGPVIGGLLVTHVGVDPAFAINGASFAVSALLVMRVHLPERDRPEQWSPVAELREGLRYSLSTPLVRGLMLVIGLVMVGAAVKSPTEPAFVFQRLHGTTQTLGLVTGVWGVGMVLGTMVAPSAVRAWRREQLLFYGILIVGGCLLATSRAVSVAPVLMLYLFAGIGNGIGSVCYETLLQERTPDAVRGRVLAACDAVFDASLLVGYVVTSALDHRFGPRAIFAIAGCIFLAAALLSRALLGSGVHADEAEGLGVGLGDAEAALADAADAADAADGEPVVVDLVETSVAVLRIHDPEQVLARREPARVLADAGGQQGGGDGLGAGGVRGDDAVAGGPQRVALGQRLGVGDVEGGARDPAPAEGAHEVVGDDMGAAGHVDQPGRVLHGPQLGLGDDAGGPGREGEGEDDGVGLGQRVVQSVGSDDPLRRWRVAPVGGVGAGPARRGDEPCPTCAWLGLSADECCLDPEWGEQPQQRLGDAARAEDGDVGAEQRAAGARGPRLGARILADVP